MTTITKPANGDPNWGDVLNTALDALNAGKAEASMVSLMPTVASATSPDIFGAVGATIDYTGTATATSFVACTAAQVGSVKRIICAGAPTFTASANLKVNGNISGNHTFPAGAILEIVAVSTTSFIIYRPYYEEHTSAGSATSGAIAVAGTFDIVRVGKLVTLSLRPFTSGAAASNVASITLGDLIPAAFRPPTYEQWSSGAEIHTGGALQSAGGLVRVQTNGTIILYRDGTTTTGWGTSTGSGLAYGFSMSWSL